MDRHPRIHSRADRDVPGGCGQNEKQGIAELYVGRLPGRAVQSEGCEGVYGLPSGEVINVRPYI